MFGRTRFLQNCTTVRQRFLALALGMACLSLLAIVAAEAEAKYSTRQATAKTAASQPEWIWTPKKTGVAGVKPQGECYFRKKFTLVRPEKAEMEISAGDEYEIYINGRLAARGQSFGSNTKMDVGPFLVPGVNLVAAKVRHIDGSSVGLAAKIRILESGETRWRSLTTDDTWRTRVQPSPEWKSPNYNDLGWLKAQAVGQYNAASAVAASAKPAATPLATTKPATTKAALASTSQGNSERAPAVDEAAASSGQATALKPLKPLATAATKNPARAEAASAQSSSRTRQTTASATGTAGTARTSADAQPARTAESTKDASNMEKRFEISPEFSVEQLLASDETGSLIAMEFNEFGKLLLSREGGPLLIADPTQPLKSPERIRVYCDAVNTCQGILPLNGDVFVTANGPSGMGLYRLSDTNNDGKLEVAAKLAGFTGTPGEHGPHGIQLGPDGMLYVIIGNNSRIDTPADPTSPYQHYYEGDLVPRFEDPGGHAVGVQAPGGTIVRVSLDGSKVETVAGGIRNAYDLVFDQQGELFIHDSDMEADMGTTWYRPTSVYHVPAGAEFGWRSGWAKFPKHFIDQTPPVCETGRGSPAGAVLYQHLQFPVRYQDSMFLADWSEGRILVVRHKPEGAGFIASAETFLKGRPLNVVDLAIGEDGALYFCTGGRGTAGGVFKVSWNGQVPDKVMNFESDLARAIRHPQPGSAWARQNIAELRIGMGAEWGPAIEGVALETRNSTKFRTRALQLMVLYGPAPSDGLLENLVQDEDTAVRAQLARVCGLKPSTGAENALRSLIADTDPLVRRVAVESMMRLGIQTSFDDLLPMLSSLDRVEAMTARRMLERLSPELWQAEILATEDKRVFIQGAVALMTAYPNLERAYQVLARGSKLMEGFVNDYDFVDLLRTMELALVRGQVNPARVPGLAMRIGNEFPSGNSTINRELARLLAYLKVGDLQGRLAAYVEDPTTSTEDKVHLGMYMQAAGKNLTPAAKLAIVDGLEAARNVSGAGGSYQLYIEQAVKNVTATITPAEIKLVLENGHQWPSAVTAAFYQLPSKLDTESVQRIIRMDRAAAQTGRVDHAMSQMRMGVIAVLARSGDEASMGYLRELWQAEPSRRNDISIGLSQQPADENWAYLVSSLDALDDLTGQEVIEKLIEVKRRPREAKQYRDLIQLGYRLRAAGAGSTIKLLKHWSGESPGVSSTVAVSTKSNGSRWTAELDAWRTWYEQKFPGADPIEVSISETKVGRYSVEELVSTLERMPAGDSQRGHALFAQAQCAQCHRFAGEGQGVGPDLTSLAQRFSLREVVEATIDPSRVVPDRYASKKIMTVDGDQFVGMAILQLDGSYLVLQNDGKRVRVAADDIEEVVDSSLSAMPTGLLDGLSKSEVNDLFSYLFQREQQTAGTKASAPAMSKAATGAVRK